MTEASIATAVVAWVITVLLNALIIFLAAGIAGARHPTYWRAIMAAAVGSIVTALIPPAAPVSAIIGFVLWLFILKGSFMMSWQRTLITAVVVWLLNIAFTLVGLTTMLLLPKLLGI
ncbi:hypothetical protein HYS54_01995 [Candidatus Micrarchaeota archaeon]|nr:hypothetical protein [Candidatus Micrarchaeota archaeon]